MTACIKPRRAGQSDARRRAGRLLRYAMAGGLIAGVLAGGAGATGATAQPRLRMAAVDGARIAYRELNPAARGTPLVLIIGYGSTMAEWDPTFIERLAEHRRVIMFDNRGMGNSTGSTSGLTIRAMADDTAGLVRTLKLGRTDVLGWSMGGFIAQQLTIQDPGLVRRLILASTDPGSSHTVTGKPAVIDVLTNPDSTPSEKLPILFPADQQAAGETWLHAIGSQPGITAADFGAPAATLAAQNTATTTGWLGRGGGTYAALTRLHAPTLVAYGTRDVIVPPANAQLLITRIPHAIGMRVRQAGHAFLFQQPAATAVAFATFLDAREAP
jgi:pimeloyl-ACP methyl ester carboxylesterase